VIVPSKLESMRLITSVRGLPAVRAGISGQRGRASCTKRGAGETIGLGMCACHKRGMGLHLVILPAKLEEDAAPCILWNERRRSFLLSAPGTKHSADSHVVRGVETLE
jgi:hypothetical protein